MLVVIAIIGILMAVLLPNLLNARRSANDADAKSFLRNMVTMAEIKRAENNDTALYISPVNCVPTFNPILPTSVETCQVRQDANASYALVESKTGNFFQFDGQSIVGPLAAAPAYW